MSTTVDIFVARQPVFNSEDEVVGYELLYRRDGHATSANHDRSDVMSAEVILNAFVGFGFLDVTGGVPAFVNADADLLRTGDILLLDPHQVIIEILETVDPTPDVVEQCKDLKERGYTLALDDFTEVDEWTALLPTVDLVKIDVLERDPTEVERVVNELRPYHVELLAERVETQKVRDRCLDLGFGLFQGHFYKAADTLVGQDLAVGHLDLLKVVNLMLDISVPDTRIEDYFMANPALTYKLLRIANSVAIASRGLTSIGHALRLLGRQSLHRWLSLLLITSLASQSALDRQLTETAIFRGRFLETLARLSRGRIPPGPCFLVGMFSMLELLTRRPLDEMLSVLRLTDDVRLALVHREGPMGPWLQFVEAYEVGDWETVDRLLPTTGISGKVVSDTYLQAIVWARGKLETVRR